MLLCFDPALVFLLFCFQTAQWDAATSTMTLPLTSATFPGQPPLDAKVSILQK
jgi:hypothetical protein